MLEILLLILKIIGIAILSVIGLLILILLIVSWVPVRYNASFEKKEHVRLSAGVSWFLKAVFFRFFMIEEGTGTALKLFGKKLSGDSGKKEEDSGSSESEEEGGSPPEKAEEKPPEKTEDVKEEAESGAETDTPAEAADKPAESPEPAAVSESPPEEAEKPPEEEAASSEEKTEEGGKTEEAGEKTEEPGGTTGEAEEEQVFIGDKIDEALDRFQTKYLLLENKWEDLSDKYEFLTCEHASREYARVFRNLGKILKHILPDHLNGHLRFGFDSPATTGKILAYYCALAPVHRYALIPEPEFSESVLEGDAELKGSIYLGYIILKLLAIVINRDTLYLVLNFRKHFRKSKEDR